MMRNESTARLEIIIAALFAFVVYLQAQNAHQYATLLQALDRSHSNQAELLGLYRRTFEAARSTPETQPHHFYQEHDGIARNARSPACSSASWTCMSHEVCHGLVSVVQPSTQAYLQLRWPAPSVTYPTVSVCRGLLIGHPAKNEPHGIVAAAQ